MRAILRTRRILAVLSYWTCALPLGALQDAVPLAIGQPVERTLTLGQSDLLALPASATPRGSSPRHLIVEQRGLDVIVMPWARGKPTDQELNNPLGRFDSEIFVLSADVSHVLIEPLAGGLPQGAYSVTLQIPGDDPISNRAFEQLTRAAAIPLRGSIDATRQAAELYEGAAGSFAEVGDRYQTARSLLSAANHRRIAGDAQAGHELYQQSLELWRELDRPGFVADSLVGLGQTARELGHPTEAAASLNEAADLFHRLQRVPEHASTRSNLGFLAQLRGDLRLAERHYSSALADFRKAGLSTETATQLLNLGTLHARLGDADIALRYERESLEIFRQLGDRHRERSALNNLAVLHRRMGEPEAALELYAQVLELATELGDQRAEAKALANRGVCYFSLGELDRAAEDYRRALFLRREKGDLAGQVITLSNLGDIDYYRGDLKTARRHLESALALARRLGHRHQAVILGNLGRLLAQMGEPSFADHFEEALTLIADRHDPVAEAALRYRHGRALQLAEQPDSAVAALEKALTLWASLGDVTGQLMAHTALGSVLRQRKQLDLALDHANRAIELIEVRRAELDNPDFRASFLSSRDDAYRLMIDLLMELHRQAPQNGYERRALEISERRRARRLLDLLTEAKVDLRAGIDPRLLDEQRRLVRRLSLLNRRRQLIARGRQKPEPEEDLAAAMREVRAHLDRVESSIRRLDSQRTTLTSASTVEVTEMQRFLEPETALLHYALGDERSYLWIVESSSLQVVELPPRREIEDLARRVHELWSTVGATARAEEDRAALRLSELMIAPALLRLDATRLIIEADGALHYVPFAALPHPDGTTRLIDQFDIARIPSVATLASHRRAKAPRRPPSIAIFADPIFDTSDPRLGGATTPQALATRDDQPPFQPETAVERGAAVGFARLPGTRLEAQRIADRLAPQDRSVFLGFAANREALAGELAGRSILHFATHAVIDTEHPELSGLVLAQLDPDGRRRDDGIVRLHDLYSLELEADLVVLSGCRTALGRELRGEGLEGLTGAFFYAGAHRVIASLWPVADHATAELMDLFYGALLEDRMSATAALRHAQRRLARDRRFRDPYFWAAFVLQGEWR